MVEEPASIEDVLQVENRVVLRVDSRGNDGGNTRSSPLPSMGCFRELGWMRRVGSRRSRRRGNHYYKKDGGGMKTRIDALGSFKVKKFWPITQPINWYHYIFLSYI